MFYNIIFIPIARFIIKIIGLFNPKLRLRENGWRQSLSSLNNIEDGYKRIWFHAASMGEFEQAKPIIELIKKRNTKLKIIVSFFSPSGYENQKNYEYADAMCYMPFDSLRDVKYFLDIIRPDISIFIRYEIWRNFLEELKKREISAYLINATKPDSKLLTQFPIISNFTKNNYNMFHKIFTVDQEQTAFFSDFGVRPEIITLSDTRFDRIAEKVEEAAKDQIIPQEYFSDNEFVLLLGSSWQPDEEIAFEAIKKWNSDNQKKIRLILVPHEPTAEHIENVLRSGLDFVLLSEIEKSALDGSILNEKKSFHILVDSIGKLLKLYSYADAAYIGGAFGVGVHSVTEPAGYGIPLATGTGMNNSPDAIKLRDLNALSVISSADSFHKWLERIVTDKKAYTEMASTAKEYISSRLGSSEKIYDLIMMEVEKSRLRK